jgi:hypothetical protein
MIRHTVAFRLKHAEGSQEESQFLAAALVLAEIPAVRNFEQLRQVSSKNNFTFSFSMEFEDQAGYDDYNSHSVHVAFVRDRWRDEVSSFMEADYVKL